MEAAIEPFSTPQEVAVVTTIAVFVLMFLSGTTMPLDGLQSALQ